MCTNVEFHTSHVRTYFSTALPVTVLNIEVTECVKIHAHFPHGCGTHFTVHTYFYTLAQGVKGCTRVESKLHMLTSGLSAVSVLRVCLLVQATYFS